MHPRHQSLPTTKHSGLGVNGLIPVLCGRHSQRRMCTTGAGEQASSSSRRSLPRVALVHLDLE